MKEKCKKQKKKSKERQKGARGAEAIVKGWELNDFVVQVSARKYANWAFLVQI